MCPPHENLKVSRVLTRAWLSVLSIFGLVVHSLAGIPLFDFLLQLWETDTSHTSETSHPQVVESKQVEPEIQIKFEEVEVSVPPAFRRSPTPVHQPTAEQLAEINAAQPINKLPVEIISKIFSSFFETNYYQRIAEEKDQETPQEKMDREFGVSFSMPQIGHYPIPKKAPPPPFFGPGSESDPVVLGQVCSHWRNITLANPNLWAKIHINGTPRSFIGRARYWLTRAGDFPLNIYLKDTGYLGGSDHDASHEIMSLIASRHHFWKDLKLDISYFTFSKLESAIPSDSTFPFLESVEIKTSKKGYLVFDYEDPAGAAAILVKLCKRFLTSPLLRTFRCPSGHFDEIPESPSWPRLTNVCFNVKDVNIQQLLGMFAMCHSMEHFIANVELIPSSLPASTPSFKNPIVLNTMQTFELSVSSVDSGRLLRHLVMPNLRTLKIVQWNLFNARRDPEGVQLFLFRSTNPLFKCFTFTESDMKSRYCGPLLDSYFCYDALAPLTKFSVKAPAITDIMVRHLTLSHGALGPNYMPLLENLELHRCRSTDGLLSNMLASRWARPGQNPHMRTLRKASFDVVKLKDSSDAFNAIDKVEFDEMRNQGFGIFWMIY